MTTSDNLTNRDRMDEREAQLRQLSETAYNAVYKLIWADDKSDFTAVESRLAWIKTIDLMLASMTAEYQQEVFRQYLLSSTDGKR